MSTEESRSDVDSVLVSSPDTARRNRALSKNASELVAESKTVLASVLEKAHSVASRNRKPTKGRGTHATLQLCLQRVEALMPRFTLCLRRVETLMPRFSCVYKG